MKTSYKILLGLSIVSQFVGVAAFFALFFYIVDGLPPGIRAEDVGRHFVVPNLVFSLFSFYCVAIQVYFIYHAARNPYLDSKGLRPTWLIVLILCGAFAMPFYWFHYIWRDEKTWNPQSG